MKRIYTSNQELLKVLSEHINIACNDNMDMVMSDKDAEKVEGLVSEYAPAAFMDYSIEDAETKESLERIAYKHGLVYVTTCSKGNNGYPKNMMGAIIGLESIEQARELASKYDLDIVQLHKRDGWCMYERMDYAIEPLKPRADWYGDDFDFFTDDERDDFYESEVQPLIREFEDFDSLQSFIDSKKEIYDELQTIDDTQIVVTCQGKYYETIDKECMKWSYDTHTYVIGLDRY